MKTGKLLSLFLATVMTMSVLPAYTRTASATSAEKNITLGTAAIKGGQQSSVYFGTYQQSKYDGDYVVSTVYRPNFEHEGYFRYYKVNVPASGEENIDWIRTTIAVQHNLNCKCNETGALPEEYEKYAYYSKEPIKWRVLATAFDYDNNFTEGTDDTTTSLFLLSDKNLDAVKYNETNTAVAWKDSTIRTWPNDSFYNSAFSANEKSLVYETVVAQASKVFLPSVEEIKNSDYGFSSKTALNTTYVYGGATTGSENLAGKGIANDYWLRTDSSTTTPPFVWYTGTLDEDGYFTVDSGDICVRPAVNINSGMILFTSAAKNGKNVNIGTVSKNADFGSISDNDGYKLTFSDSDRRFSVSETKVTADKSKKVTFTYKDASTGDNEYISAMIVKGNEVLYYGQLKNIKNTADASGTVDFSIPVDIDYGEYTLKIFNEQINGDYRTDLSSGFSDVSLTVSEEVIIPDNEKTITLGYSALSDSDTENKKFDYIYYKTRKEGTDATKWRVLSTKGNSTTTAAGTTDTATYKTATDNVYTGNALFCISDEILTHFPFGADAKWQGSSLQTLVQSK